MGDYIRFISGDCTLSLRQIEAIFKAVDEAFTFLGDASSPTHCEVYYDSQVLAALDVHHADDDLFEEDIQMLAEQVMATDEPRKGFVLSRLRAANWLLALELYEAGHIGYDRIDQVWDMLFEQCSGLLQIDEEGYYDMDGEVLMM
jgi:hypothetical protein